MNSPKVCPWCGRVFKKDDRPLKHHETGRLFCDRDCYELDRKYPPKPRAEDEPTARSRKA
jgi:hypothetical protein